MGHPSRFLAIAALSAIVVTGCGSKAQPATADAGAAAGSGSATGRRGGGGGTGAASLVPVSIATVVEKPMVDVFRAVGNVEAASTVEIRSQLTGQLMTVGFREGDDVQAGQVLFALDERPFQAALDQMIATLAKDAVQSRNADAMNARNADLLAKKLLPQADYDTSAANAASLRAALQADQAQVDNAKLQLQFAKITAPVSGRTGALMVHPGALVRANDTNALVVINQISPVNVAFAVPSNLLGAVRDARQRGALPVQASVAGSTSPPSNGTISFIDNAVDPTTDTIRLKGTFANADHRLWPGQFVEIDLQLSRDEHAIVVPSAAVQSSQQGTFVYVVKPDKTVEMRPVKVARSEGDDAVIASGVQPGEVVVTDGQLRLVPGARISVKPAIGGSKGSS